jgi:TolB-like protein/class 3 adenylate cyclase/cytochrome c-type biogenesis protein CcmH/NrfG
MEPAATAPRAERRLAAILAADIVGYSRLVEQDEAGTLAAIKGLREGAIDPLLAEHKGRVVKLMGDGVIVEFASVVDAVACAVAVQKAAADRQAKTPADRRIVFRIGVNLGDVVVDGDDLLGDGVNVAARLEQLCEPGGVLVSGTAYDQLQGKLPYPLDDIGERRLKNIERSIRVYAVRAAAEDRSSAVRSPVPTPALSGKLSIAVLPFTNLSGDPQQQYFADGITEDIITDLSRFHDLDVIARNSSFAHRGEAGDLCRIGQDLGVRYMLSGSLQRHGDRVRVSAQLVDVATGVHVWSERWERSAADVFAVQTEIAERTANVLAGEGVILHAAAALAKRKRPDDLTAYERYLLGKEHGGRFTSLDAEQALQHYRAALEWDPSLARVWVGLASCLSQLAGFSSEPESLDRQSVEAARRAVELDPMDAEAHAALGEGLGYAGATAEAEATLERAVALNPSSADILARYAGWAPRFGKPERGSEAADRARLLNPNWPVWYNMYLCRAYFFAGRYADALAMVERKPPTSVHLQDMVYAAASAAMLGRLERTRLWRERALANFPALTAEWHLRSGGPGSSSCARSLPAALGDAGPGPELGALTCPQGRAPRRAR